MLGLMLLTDSLLVQKVNMGNQKHTSPLKRADEDGSLTWDLKIPLVAQVPIKNRIVKVELHRTSSRTKSGKLLATALIPLFQLMGFRQGALMSSCFLMFAVGLHGDQSGTNPPARPSYIYTGLSASVNL